MTYFKNNRWVYWMIAILVVLNLFTMGMLWMQNNHGPRGERGGERIGKERTRMHSDLGLTEEQNEQFRELKKAHRKEASVLFDSIKETKKAKLEVLTTAPLNRIHLDSLDQMIGSLHIQMENSLNQHYKDLSAICNDEQKEKLKERFKKAFNRGHKSGRKKRGR